MKNIIIFSNDTFFKKNLVKFVNKKKLNYKLIFFSNLNNKNISLLKKIIHKNLFVIVNNGLSGSIQYNIKNGPKIYEHNTKLYYNILTNLRRLSFRKVFFVSASCAYPNNKNILKETHYGFPPLEITNYFYSLSKIFATNICKQINLNKNFKYITLVPATLYGKFSTYHKINSHVLIALLNKLKSNSKNLILWGSGKPKREFIFIEDFIDAIFFIYNHNLRKDIINVGTKEDISIKKLASIIKKLVNFRGKITWDKTKEDGMMRKLLDSSYLFKKGWKPQKNLYQRLKEL